MQKFLLPALFLMLYACSGQTHHSDTLSPAITPADIKTHIMFLASDSLNGRATGTPGAAKAAHYIADQFNHFGLQPAGINYTYYQEFTINSAALNNPRRGDSTHFADQKRIARNVIGLLKGAGQSQSYLVIGAHFDHPGMGRFDSLSPKDQFNIHNGADDNASGVSGLLELAQYFSRHPTRKSLLFIAFSGEELGLLGSQYFVNHPTIPLDSVQAMINLDMIGRLKDDKLLIAGTGSASRWDALIAKANTDSLAIKTLPGGAGAGDHTSFYYKEIPVLHYFTDSHQDYHRPSDDTKYINIKGEDRVLEHLKRLILALDTLKGRQLTFTETTR